MITDHSYSKLPKNFYQIIDPEKAPNPKLIRWNKELADSFGWSSKNLLETNLASLFSGHRLPEGAKPLAMAYAGHQFGRFVPQLGDGRAHLLGEVKNQSGLLLDIQLKGSGQTQFSRRGDGKSSLGPVLREYIVSESMAALGVPTTRALAAVLTGETVFREDNIPGAVFTRVAESHIRVGTFEFFASQKDIKSLKVLLEYAANRHYPDILNDPDLPLSFFTEVVKKQAILVSHWMGLGFIHGVMNTDNTSIAGITIDYGPCAFMDEFDYNKVFSSIDHLGRYSYSNQPPIALWNLGRLADTLLLLYEENEIPNKIKEFEFSLEDFRDLFQSSWMNLVGKKLGFETCIESDLEIISLWFDYLNQEKLDFTLSFRNLSSVIKGDSEFYPATEQFNKFKMKWLDRINSQNKSLEEIQSYLNGQNPELIPRNHQIEKAINQAIEGDFSLFHRICDASQSPYEIEQKNKDLTLPPEPKERVQQTFCGT